MFDCIFDECPKDQAKCHLYWKMPWENQETGEVRIREGCIISQDIGLPIVQALIRSAHTSSEHASHLRNSFDKAGPAIHALTQAVVERHNQQIGIK